LHLVPTPPPITTCCEGTQNVSSDWRTFWRPVSAIRRIDGHFIPPLPDHGSADQAGALRSLTASSTGRIRGTIIASHTLEIPMTEQLGQTKRVAELTTPLGKDVLALVRFEGTEGLGELFDYHIEALSKQENIDFDKALGQGCALKIDA
jgi:hypothetical protein